MKSAVAICLYASLGGFGVLGSACGVVGDGKGALAGTLFVRSCTNDSDYGTLDAPQAFNLKPTFFVAAPTDDFSRPNPMNRLSIREQAQGNLVEEADAMIMVIADDHDVATELGTDIAVGAATNVRATLSLNQTCPDAEVALELDGTVNFSVFGNANPASVPNDFKVDFDDRIAATFSFNIVDRRAITLGGVGGVSPDAAAAGHVDGYFDFVVRQGKAAQF